MLTQEHAQTARAFLDEADREFAEGDALQASEKMWGARVSRDHGCCHAARPGLWDT